MPDDGKLRTKTRNRAIPSQSLRERLLQSALEARGSANKLPPGREREMLLRRTRQAEAASELEELLSSPLMLTRG